MRLRRRARQAEAALREDGPLDASLVAEMMQQVAVYQVELEAQNEELAQAREELEAARDHLANLYDSAPISYVTIGQDGRIEDANLEAANLLGIARSRLRGMRLADFILADDHGIFIRQFMPGPDPPASWTCTLRLKRTDNTILHGQLTASRHRAEGAGPPDASTQIVLADVSESVRAEHEMLSTAEKLGDTVAARNRELELTGVALAAKDVERVRAQENLLAEQRKLTDIMDGLPDGVLLISSANTVIYANPAAIATFGPIAGRKCHDYLFQNETECPWCPHKDIGGGQSTAWSWTAPGSDRSYEIHAVPIRGADGDHSRLVVCRDVTARRITEDALKSSEARLTTAQRIASLGDWTWHLDSGKVDWSEDTYRILGHPPGSLTPTVDTFLQMVMASDIDHVKTAVARVEDGAASLDLEINITGGDGHARTVHVRGERVAARDGHGPAITGTIQDVSARKLAERERARLYAAIESVDDAILVTDASGVVLYANAGLQTVTGFTREEVIGQVLPLMEQTPGDEYPPEIRQQLTAGQGWRGVVTAQRKDGSVYKEENSISPSRDATGQVVNLVVIKRDVTAKLALESIAEAVSIMSNTGYIFAGIRHEIGNPINAIRATLQHIRTNIEKSPVAGTVKYIDRAIEEITGVEQLLGSLKSFNRFENPQIQKIQVETFLSKFESLVRHSMAEEGIDLKTSVAPGAEGCLADPRALQQVLLNVVANAVDACAGMAEGRISIDATRSGEEVVLLVADNGRGIAPANQRMLFKPFFTTKAHGSGLGLVIVKKLLTLMSGDLEITSQEGSGTSIRIQLPASPADA